MATQPPGMDTIGAGVGQPASFLFLVTPSDTADLQFITRAIRVGGAGDLAVKTVGGSIVVIPSVVAGETLAIRAVTVYDTGTDATEIMGMA